MLYSYNSSIPPEDPRNIEANKNNVLSWNGVDASAKVRPTESEVAKLCPEFREVWNRDFKNAPNRPLGLIFSVER
jgi:hypothetical protein